MQQDVRSRSGLVGVVAPLALAAGVLLAGCETQTTAAGTTINRDTFVSTYVDLRLAVLQPDPGKMNDSIRSAILARHGVTAQQLEDFVKVHGSDVSYMRSVWNQVDTRMRDTRPDTSDTSDSPVKAPAGTGSARQPGG